MSVSPLSLPVVTAACARRLRDTVLAMNHVKYMERNQVRVPLFQGRRNYNVPLFYRKPMLWVFPASTRSKLPGVS